MTGRDARGRPGRDAPPGPLPLPGLGPWKDARRLRQTSRLDPLCKAPAHGIVDADGGGRRSLQDVEGAPVWICLEEVFDEPALLVRLPGIAEFQSVLALGKAARPAGDVRREAEAFVLLRQAPEPRAVDHEFVAFHGAGDEPILLAGAPRPQIEKAVPDRKGDLLPACRRGGEPDRAAEEADNGASVLPGGPEALQGVLQGVLRGVPRGVLGAGARRRHGGGEGRKDKQRTQADQGKAHGVSSWVLRHGPAAAWAGLPAEAPGRGNSRRDRSARGSHARIRAGAHDRRTIPARTVQPYR